MSPGPEASSTSTRSKRAEAIWLARPKMGLRDIMGLRRKRDDSADDEGRNLDQYRHGGKTIDFSDCEVLERDPVLDSGGWVFKGTSIKLKEVLWYIGENHNLDEAVHEFYGEVDREAMAQALRYMGEQLSTKGL